MKKIVMALAAVMFAALFFAQPAEARCWWDGWRSHCTRHHHHYWSRYYYRPYYYGYYYRPYYRPYYYRPYVCTPWPLCWG